MFVVVNKFSVAKAKVLEACFQIGYPCENQHIP